MPTPEHRLPDRSNGRGRRRRRAVGWLVVPAIVTLAGVGGYVGFAKFTENFGEPSCRAMASGQEVIFSPEQTANAATITAIALKRGLPARAATIGIATSIQESKLRNITYGDRDSLGLFQQRPSQGWGTEKQIMDPVYATNKFYDALVKIDGYEDMVITKVAQLVQRSGYPEAYADHEQEGRMLASALAGHSRGGIGCRLNAATASTPAATIAAHLTTEMGVQATVEAGHVGVAGRNALEAWAVGSWAVAHADAEGITSVTVGDRTWTRARSEEAWSWQAADTPVAANSVTITRL